MIPLVLLRGPLLLLAAALVLASCKGGRPEPIVDMSPIGDALRFMAVALVLGAIIRGILALWEKH